VIANPVIFSVEVVAIILFGWGLLEVRKQGSARSLEFFMIFIYGLILEELDMRIFKSYHYSPDFFFKVGQVPVCIALLWAAILASSMAISDKIGLPRLTRPFLDAILAVWIDLSIDAIAIRLNYWSWVIPLNEGWFGVPAGNLYAWMWVAFFYSALARVLRHLIEHNDKWKWGYVPLPAFAYAGLFVSMNTVGWLGETLGLRSQAERLYIFWSQFVAFLVVVLLAWRHRKSEHGRIAPVWIWSRAAIHLYFILAFFLFGIFREMPVLGVIGLGVFLCEVLFLKQWGNAYVQERSNLREVDQ